MFSNNSVERQCTVNMRWKVGRTLLHLQYNELRIFHFLLGGTNKVKFINFEISSNEKRPFYTFMIHYTHYLYLKLNTVFGLASLL